MTKNKNQIGLLIHHYKIFYSGEYDTFETFCEWCGLNDDQKAYNRFSRDLSENSIDTDYKDVYNLVESAGIIASAYEFLKFNIDDNSFLSFYEMYKHHQDRDMKSYHYKRIFKTDISNNLKKMINKKWFINKKKMNNEHFLNILTNAKQQYDNKGIENV